MFYYFYAITLCCVSTVNCFQLNATGGAFTETVYQQSSFAYQFGDTNDDSVDYTGIGATGGKCNVMGYWHSSNANSFLTSTRKAKDTLFCTDKCTLSNCGFDSKSTLRPDRNIRSPLVDFGGSSSTLSDNDYEAFPDLQMLPAMAGAVVPIYNIPELAEISNSLVLSRSTIVNIFLGNIRFLNDSRILNDNTGTVRQILSGLSKEINVVVRTDSGGQTEIFSLALGSFSPATSSTPDYSFKTTVGPGSAPNWCGKLTDEIQVITIDKCNSSMSSVDRLIRLKLVRTDFILRDVSFACDSPADTVRRAFDKVYGNNTMYVRRSNIGVSGLSYSYTVGYRGSAISKTNMHEPYVVQTAAPVTVTLSTLQEGGYLNVHFNSTYVITQATQSIWVNTAVNASFNISNPNSATPWLTSTTINPSSSSLVNDIRSAAGSVAPSLIASVLKVPHTPSSPWIEIRILFTNSAATELTRQALAVHLIDASQQGHVAVTTFLRGNNYPLFYDNRHPRGYSGSGKYTCYKPEHDYKEWSYYTGYLNKGVRSEVARMSYSIGYVDFMDAINGQVDRANIINKAGNVIQASSTSVTYALMELGGSLNDRLNAPLVDGASAKCWPITGYDYVIIRTRTHLGSCERRKAAMRFLYYFYTSDGAGAIAAKLGFATLPNSIRDIVLGKLVDVAMCSNGEYALPEFKRNDVNILSLSDVATPVSNYLSAYYAIDSKTKWNLSTDDSSSDIWSRFIGSPESYVGAFTMFMSEEQKRSKYMSNNGRNILTTGFSHFAVVPIYHLNAFTAVATGPLRVTANILAKIYTGEIQNWNHTLIRMANWENRNFLPNQQIRVVGVAKSSNANQIFTRYLAAKSPEFKSAYGITGIDGSRSVDFLSVLNPVSSLLVRGNPFVDNFVTTYDSTIGFFMQLEVPASKIAKFCTDSSCSNPISPNVQDSIAACESDSTTALYLSPTVKTYDLMFSNAAGCYPFVGTLDYSVLAEDNAASCSTVSLQSIRFSAWIFNDSNMIQPLDDVFMKGTSDDIRMSTRTNICNIKCDSSFLGYKYCNYRDCTWVGGDYTQKLTECNYNNEKRKIEYILIDGTDCIQSSNKGPSSPVYIECDHIEDGSATAGLCYFLGSLGSLICIALLIGTLIKRDDKKIRRAKPLFMYVFLLGALMMNCTVFVYIGPNTDQMCMLRPWLYNISLTVMYGPLVMKLYTVEKLVHSTRIKKTISTDYAVVLEVLSMVVVDVIILIVWSVLETPKQVIVSHVYSDVMLPVDNYKCSSESTSQIVMLVFQFLILGTGLFKAVGTWHVTADISESKQYSIALLIGAIAYLMIVFVDFGGAMTLLIRCVSLFITGTMAVCLIMIPKFIKKKQANAKLHSAEDKRNNFVANGSVSRSDPNVRSNDVKSGGDDDQQTADRMTVKQVDNSHANNNNEMCSPHGHLSIIEEDRGGQHTSQPQHSIYTDNIPGSLL